MIGSRRYRAPEIYAGDASFLSILRFVINAYIGLEWSFPVDIFALGCTLFELYTGHHLFLNSDYVPRIFQFMERTIQPFTPNFAAEIGVHRPNLFFSTFPPRVNCQEPEVVRGGISFTPETPIWVRCNFLELLGTKDCSRSLCVIRTWRKFSIGFSLLTPVHGLQLRMRSPIDILDWQRITLSFARVDIETEEVVVSYITVHRSICLLFHLL